MAHITRVEALEPYWLRLWFEDGSIHDVDMGEVLERHKGIVDVHSDPARFAEVRVEEGFGTIEWPGGLDFDPDVLHGDYAPVSGRPYPRRIIRGPSSGTCRRRPKTIGTPERVPSEVSRFHDIVITMPQDDQSRAHFRAAYDGHEARIEIGSGHVIEGDFPPTGLELVREWEELRRADLASNWQRARDGAEPRPIPPLT